VDVEVRAFEDVDGLVEGVVSLGGKFLERKNEGCCFLLKSEGLGWVEEGDAQLYGGGCGDDSLFSSGVCGGSSKGRPGECAGLFEGVGVSAEGGVEVFSDHDAGFEGVVGVAGLDEGVDVSVVVFLVLDGDEGGGPAEVVVDGGDVGVDCVVQSGLVLVLGGEDDEEIWVFFRDDVGSGEWFLGVGGNERELIDKKEGDD